MLLVASGFFSNGPVQVALAVSSGAAVVCAVVGVFTVLRGQAFAGHALADVSSAGGAAALLFGLRPLAGFLAMALAGAIGMAAGEARQMRERDLASGVVLGAGLGLTALFLHLDTTMAAAGGAAGSVMFGSMFAIPAALIAPALAVAVLALAVMAVIGRPLLLIALDPGLAASRGVRLRLVGFVHLAVLALAVALAAMTVGAILATALLIGPAAAALRLTRRVASAVVLACAIGLFACWGGILLAYDSYGWTPGHVWPASFFVVALILGAYAAAGLAAPALALRHG